MGEVTENTCCGVDVDTLIDDLHSYRRPIVSGLRAEQVLNALLFGKDMSALPSTYDASIKNDLKTLIRCNQCREDNAMLAYCSGRKSCSGVHERIARDIDLLVKCPDKCPVIKTEMSPPVNKRPFYANVNGTMGDISEILPYDIKPIRVNDVLDASTYMTKFLPKVEEDKNVDLASSFWKNYVALKENEERRRMETHFTPKSIEWSADHRTVVVIWNDTEKTIVRLSPNDPDDIYMAFTAALAKRIFGTNSHIKKVIGRNLNEHKAKDKKAEPNKNEEA